MRDLFCALRPIIKKDYIIEVHQPLGIPYETGKKD
jgi:hypothetical protein